MEPDTISNICDKKRKKSLNDWKSNNNQILIWLEISIIKNNLKIESTPRRKGRQKAYNNKTTAKKLTSWAFSQ